ncbi:hypothetical protein LTT66_18140 [Nocardia gipuzkoensis]|uniref:hypothetical protein n=1 Tax=Nocardia gipuzkoensis TaxID=2749991 RepID=UPI001E285168|nr:hypothetical protein [Nocardia gipuzkoensis]UGT65290.1 hypothetical protein LTT66_18140 [Nocardia gipuzkoensis]
MGGPVPHSQHPAGWYRTMDRGFAVDHFGFPALPRRGERHTAPDGSVWEFALTGTDWWELAEYAPSETDRSIGTFHDDARSGRETLRIIDRALWVDHGDGNLDGLTPELPIWADEWAERIVAAVNGQPAQVITDPAEMDALPWGSVVLAYGVAHQACPAEFGELPAWLKPTGMRAQTSAELLADTRGAGVTVLYVPTENGDGQ